MKNPESQYPIPLLENIEGKKLVMETKEIIGWYEGVHKHSSNEGTNET